MKDGPNISGNISDCQRGSNAVGQRQLRGNPGHDGWGKITGYICGPVPAP
jgi:hypothetical protein